MQHDGIHAIAERDPVEPVAADQAQNSAHFGLVVLDVRCAERQPRSRAARTRRNRRVIEHLDQRSDAGRLDADRFDHGHAQFARQAHGVDGDSLAARDVDHVERHHHGQAEPLQAQHQPEVLAQIGRIGDAHDEVRLALAAAAAEQHIGGHLLIRRQRIEAVGARQIQDADPLAGRREQRALLAFDRDPGVIGDLLPAAGQDIE